MARLNRTESQAKTRAALVAKATTCFLRDGYAATSLESIAVAAGYSKGAVYSNFRNKDELGLAVLDAIRATQIESLARMMLGTETLDERITALERWADEHVGDRAWASLEAEFAVHASRDPALQKQIVQTHRAFRRNVIAFASALDVALPIPAEDAAVALLSLGIGLGLQRAIDPSLSVRSLGKVARLLVAPLKRRG